MSKQKLYFIIQTILCFIAPFLLFSADQAVWELGTKNGSSAEFSPQYNPWEYGNALAIQKSPAMDHQTHTFHYKIRKNEHVLKPKLVSGINTESIQSWMFFNELVSGLQLLWDESTSGTRRLVLDLVDWRNQQNVINGFEILLPNGSKKIMSLPNGMKGPPQTYEVIFPVNAGSNSLIIRIVTMAKHYRFSFDRIALFHTDAHAEKLPLLLESNFNADDGIFHPNDLVKLHLRAYNQSKEPQKVHWTVKNAFEKTVAKGKCLLQEGNGKI